MSVILHGTNGETFPTWTNATRPGSPNVGQTGYNSDAGELETWTGSAWYPVSGLVLGTVQNTTSGVSIDFTGIPAWARKVTLGLVGVSTNGSSPIQIQLGSGAPTTSGYSTVGGGTGTGSANTCSGYSSFTTGFQLDAYAPTSAYTRTGMITFMNVSGNVWVGSGIVSSLNIDYLAGSISLGGVLDRLRITTVNGTDVFDAGSANVMWEG